MIDLAKLLPKKTTKERPPTPGQPTQQKAGHATRKEQQYQEDENVAHTTEYFLPHHPPLYHKTTQANTNSNRWNSNYD